MQQFSKRNKGFRYLLTVLDAVGLFQGPSEKKGETVAKAFKSIFKEGKKPEFLWTDEGKEFYNKHVKDLLDQNKIAFYSVTALRSYMR